MQQGNYVNSPYRCTTCKELVENKKQAERHILLALGLILNGVATEIEKRFIVEDRVL